jgi:hypothetical protein
LHQYLGQPAVAFGAVRFRLNCPPEHGDSRLRISRPQQ